MKILKFSASWCGACKQLEKELSTLKGVEVQSIDVDEEESEPLIEKYDVKSLPTLIYLEGDKEIYRSVGLVKANVLQETWNKLKENEVNQSSL